jgi:hypothetical protein
MKAILALIRSDPRDFIIGLPVMGLVAALFSLVWIVTP